MRHRVYGKKLGRNKNERALLFKSLVHSLFLHGTIETSESKAKAVKGLVDKVINLAKSKNTQRLLQSYLVNKSLRERLVKEIAPKLDDRVSGYTSLIRLGERLGDKSMRVKMSIINSEKLEPIKEKVSREKKVSQVSRGRKTRDTHKPRGTQTKRTTLTSVRSKTKTKRSKKI